MSARPTHSRRYGTTLPESRWFRPPATTSRCASASCITPCSSRPRASNNDMAQEHAVEVLLRPAVELYTMAVCALGTTLCLAAPWSLALTPRFGLVSAFAFGALGFRRWRQAHVILRYRRHIRRL